MTSFGNILGMAIASLINSVIPTALLVLGLRFLNGTIYSLEQAAGVWLLIAFVLLTFTYVVNYISTARVVGNVFSAMKDISFMKGKAS